jgi:hypothetical protein
MHVKKPNRKVRDNKMSNKNKTTKVTNRTITVKLSKNPKNLDWIDKLFE